MSLLVTGSIGIDTVETPAGRAVDVLGGSAVYFAFAASFFTPVRLVGVVGEDCPKGFLKPLEENPRIDLGGLEVRRGSRTFRWHGRYHQDVNERDTVAVQVNVLGEAGPRIPPRFRDSRFVFLANTNPELQLQTLAQLDRPALVAADTMDLWIRGSRPALRRLLRRVDGLIVNDSEARMLAGRANLIAAGRQIASTVRRFVVVKKGEHGSLLFVRDRVFALPGFPTQRVVDPTGAGDCFAGGILGFLAANRKVTLASLRRAIAYGTVVASLALEDFSVGRLRRITRKDVDARLREFRRTTAF